MIKSELISMAQIRPIKDLRNATEISELCNEKNEPVYITKNGYGHLIVMSMETYKEKLAKAELYEKLAEAEMQLDKPEELLDAEMVFERLKEKYGGK
jgi:PHD/YefM family antitoxin component YafN of YafNO toxin-antitoxin module